MSTQERTIYGYVDIIELATDKVIDTITVHFPKGSSQYDRMEMGLARKIDFERFRYVERDA